jgi:uncharacterized membrane protein
VLDSINRFAMRNQERRALDFPSNNEAATGENKGFLSAFILMSENRQGRLADRRSRVNLQVDMIAEREITKLMGVVVEIRDHLGMHRRVDPELDNMQKATNIEHLTEAAQTVEDRHTSNSNSKEASK